MEVSTIITLAIAAIAVLLLYRTFAPVRGLKELGDRAFREQLQAAPRKLLIDVREPSEFRNGHIKGATNIPLSQLSSQLNKLPKDKEIFLNCQSGMRSKRAAAILLKHGFKQVSHLKGGMLAWTGERE